MSNMPPKSMRFGEILRFRSTSCSPVYLFCIAALVILIMHPVIYNPVKEDAPQQVTPTATSVRFQSAQMQPHLHRAALSHIAFHGGLVKDGLLQLVSGTPNEAVAVAGVSFGAEVLRFAKQGRRVFAFEPMPDSVSRLQKIMDSAQPKLDIQLFAVATSDKYGPGEFLEVAYNRKSKRVAAERMDRLVPQNVNISVLSVDIQGAEFAAIRGASGFLPRVKSLWIEIFGCGKENLKLFEYLDDQYVLFDFAPWGEPKGKSWEKDPATSKSKMFEREAFLFSASRPGDYVGYLKWLCDTRREKFNWLQTDIVAIRRDLFLGSEGEQMVKDIDNLHVSGCSNNKCALRNLAAKE